MWLCHIKILLLFNNNLKSCINLNTGDIAYPQEILTWDKLKYDGKKIKGNIWARRAFPLKIKAEGCIGSPFIQKIMHNCLMLANGSVVYSKDVSQKWGDNIVAITDLLLRLKELEHSLEQWYGAAARVYS